MNRQLVVTIGPASYGVVPQLTDAGATAFRLNSSHLQTIELERAARRIRQEACSVPIVVDLQGAKMRLGWFPERTVAAGEVLRFGAAERGQSPGEGQPRESRDDEVPLPHPELFAEACPGEIISIDDGRVLVRLDAVSRSRLQMDGTCIRGGRLAPRKGVNRSEHPVDATDLCDADVRAIEATLDLHPEYAISFVRDGSELSWVRRRASGAALIAKVERAEALEALPRLATEADALWICRGDLGAQLGLPALARAVARIDPRRIGGGPILMAGQVFEHMTRHPIPTRSEVCHLADLVDRGYAGIVLSDETAIGDDPVRAVTQAAELLASL